MSGTVLEVFKNYVKVKTPTGERVLKVRGKDLPGRGWILEMKRSDPSPNLIGSVVLDSMDPLPPLREIVPIIESAGSVESFDAIFLSEMTRMVSKRLGYLPKWYYKDLGKYYKEGEVGKEGVFSEIVFRALGKGSDLKKVKPEKNDSFGDWLNHLSFPYYFRSYRDSRRPTRLFLKRGKSATFRIDRITKDHGRVIVEGVLGPSDAKLKVSAEKPLDPGYIEKLRSSLETVYENVYVVQGGMFLGYR